MPGSFSIQGVYRFANLRVCYPQTLIRHCCFLTLLVFGADNHVPKPLVQALFKQLFSFVNVQLFNQLLLRRECCSFSNGEYVKTGLAQVRSMGRHRRRRLPVEYNVALYLEEYRCLTWDEKLPVASVVAPFFRHGCCLSVVLSCWDCPDLVLGGVLDHGTWHRVGGRVLGRAQVHPPGAFIPPHTQHSCADTHICCQQNTSCCLCHTCLVPLQRLRMLVSSASFVSASGCLVIKICERILQGQGVVWP